MIAISILILHLASLLSAIIPNAYAWQHETFDATTLDDLASSSQNTLVAFVSPNDPRTTRLEPEWNKLISLKTDNPNLGVEKYRLLSIDCLGNKVVCDKHGVTTEKSTSIVLYHFGSDGSDEGKMKIEYLGPWKGAAILPWLQRRTRRPSPPTTSISTLDDLRLLVLRSPNCGQSSSFEEDDVTSSSTSTSTANSDDFDKETIFLLFDTSSLLPTTSGSGSDSSSYAANAVTPKQAFQSFAENYRDEPLRFGIIEDVKSADVLGEMAKEIGIGLDRSGPTATVVCLRCGGVEGRVETWVVPQSQSEARPGGVGEVEEHLKRWMEETARPVIGELTGWNYGRIRETENILPTVYVFARSHQQRINLRRTLSALATKYHSSLHIMVVDPIMFPDLMKGLGLSLDSDSNESGGGGGGGSGVAGAVVWPQKSTSDSNANNIEKLIYHYPKDKPITEANIKQWGSDLCLGRVKPWLPPSSSNDELKKKEDRSGSGSASGSGRDEVLRDLTNRVRVVKGGKKATRKAMKRTGSGSGSRSGSIPGVKIRVAGRDEL